MYTKEEVLDMVDTLKQEVLNGKLPVTRKENEFICRLMKTSSLTLVTLGDLEGVMLNIDIFIEILSRLRDKKVENILEEVMSSRQFVSEN